MLGLVEEIGSGSSGLGKESYMHETRSIVWNSKYEIGVPRIDFEHRIFADLITSFADRIARGKDRLALSRTLREIIKYADFHFTSEENMMEECQYPGLKEHISMHRALQNTLNDKAMSMAGGLIDPEELLGFLIDWFLDHTTREDTRIALYCRQLETPPMAAT